MKKYKIYNIKQNADGARVWMRASDKSETSLFVPDCFADGMKIGDKVRAFGKIPNMYVAWSYRNRVILSVKPLSDYAVQNFVANYMDGRDKMYFQYILVRALSARGITPSFRVSENLRLFLHDRISKIR